MGNTLQGDDHYALILEAAQAAVVALHKHGIKCALFGSLAVKLWAGGRIPKDVDLLTFPPSTSSSSDTAAQIKDLIVKTDSRFFLKMPKDPKKDYRVLWFRTSAPAPASGNANAECKVDILIPGIMDLPDLGVKAQGVVWRQDRDRSVSFNPTLPTLPFPIVLLHKLQGWADHRIDDLAYKRAKQEQDVEDIKRLLTLQDIKYALVAASNITPDPAIWKNPKWFSADFQEETERRVRLFCYYFPKNKKSWARMGFDTKPVHEEVMEEKREVRLAMAGMRKAMIERGQKMLMESLVRV